MSTERSDNDVTGTRRRRSPFAVASVAAAVLLAGGGGAYWAAAASGGGGDSPDSTPAAGTGGTPPALVLDGPGDGTSRGIAPGEPDPTGGGVVYRAAGPLPDGPGRAAVRHARGTVSADEVARLARALDVAGTPVRSGTDWTVGSGGDGSGPFLRVGQQAPGTWTFARHGSGGTDNCRKGPTCSSGELAGTPVSEQAAKSVAAPVLKALGQGDASLDAGQLMGGVRVVNADPKADGLPTYGWSTGVQVGPGGDVVGGSGQLKGLTKGAEYPVISAGDALKQLNGRDRRGGHVEIGGCATPVPDSSDLKAPRTPCAPRTGTTTVTIDKAVFGLSAQYANGQRVLVPSWLFSTRPVAGGPGSTIAQVAVDPASLVMPGPPAKASPAAPQSRVTSYGVEGRTLTVTFWGGVCDTYRASAVEDDDTVRVTVTKSPSQTKRACVMIAKQLTRPVTLDAPLGDRKVVDAASGSAVPLA
ncbi:hypothetical protein [Streptomyces sp. DT171]|uniref:hypothetical protein n=1 Tax=Streptomyces sp. DT171 TaxID=3416524 RepID=UPI003CEF36DC